MSRARIEGRTLVVEDPLRNRTIEVYENEGDVAFDDGERALWIRASDAASVGDWLRRTFAAQDWRNGVDQQHTSIPLEPKE